MLTACGRKGPPLAPLVYLPRAATELAAKRIEGDIVLQFKIPTENTDRSAPADLERVDVYAHTGPLPAPADFLEYGTLVRSVRVKDPKAKDEPPSDSGFVEQGWDVSIRETLTEKHKEPGPLPPSPRSKVPPPSAEALETTGTVNFPMPVARYYTVVGVSNSRNRRGPYAGPIRVPLVDPLPAPADPEVTYTADTITLSWARLPEDAPPPSEAPAETRGAVPPPRAVPANTQETPGTFEIYADVETEGTTEPPMGSPPAGKPQPPPSPRFGYNVYEVAAPNASAAPDASGAADAPVTANAPAAPVNPFAPTVPLNKQLITAPTFADARLEFGVERCYAVRRVEMVAGIPVESAPTSPICVTPIDRFPPARPKSLQSVSSENAVSLIWEPNTEADLAGYLVLRGEAPGDKLSPLTPAPITETSYRDTTVARNRSYVYEVIAVDNATPPNESEPSNRIEETIR